MMMESCLATGPSSVPLCPPPPVLSSVSTFHPPTLLSPTSGVGPHPSSFSSSCGSSSSTTGSNSGGGGLGDNSSRCSAGSSSFSGSNPRLNNSLCNNKTPIQTIPPPLGSSNTGLYQIHDGFATVRKRKGPSAASIAMRQQEEIYDLAQPISLSLTSPNYQQYGSLIQNGTGNKSAIKSRHSFLGVKTLASPCANYDGTSIASSGSSNGSNKKCSPTGSASLLSTHPSLNLGKIHQQHPTGKPLPTMNSFIPVKTNKNAANRNGTAGLETFGVRSPVGDYADMTELFNGSKYGDLHTFNGLAYGNGGNGVMIPVPSPLSPNAPPGRPWENTSNGVMMIETGPSSVPIMSSCGNPNCRGDLRPWPLSCGCICSCSCTCRSTPGLMSPSLDAITPAPTARPSSANIPLTSSIHKRPNKPTTSNSTTSLGRKLRRFVLPSKTNDTNGIVSPTPLPPSVHQFHSTIEAVPSECTLVPIRKSPSATAALGSGGTNGQYYPIQPPFPADISQSVRLRNSISDNSISAGLRLVVPNGGDINGGNGSLGVPSPTTPTGSGGIPGGATHNGRHFHRSCLLPKAPPLEPVMEDGIPWRQTRKDVPWWELAIRRGRYRSCPILQATPQAHVVAAFEQSLSNMTQRLQTLTLTAEQKDSELTELKNTIECLRKQSVEAGLTVAQMTGVGTRDESPMARQLSADSVSSINSISSACSATSHSHTSSPSGQAHMTPSGTPTHGANLVTPDSPGSKKKLPKGKGWLRSSFTKAFSRSKSKTRNSSPDPMDGIGDYHIRSGSNGDANGGHHHHGNANTLGHPSHHHQSGIGSHHHRSLHHQHHQAQNSLLKVVGHSMPTSPLLSPPAGDGRKNSSSCSVSTGSHSPRSNGGAVSHDGRSRQGSSSGLSEDQPEEPKSVDELKKQLREKEMCLTDIRLEALTSAHQLESLKETVTKMRNEMLSLKQDNERLQRMVTCKSLTSSQTSLQLTTDGIDRRLSASEVPPPSSTTLEMFCTDSTEKEGKRITVSVYLGSHGSYERYITPIEGVPAQECIIGTISVSNKTKWDALDSLVKRAFKDYLMRIDPVCSLGLNHDSVLSYAVGEILRTKDGIPPELLPCGYLVGDVTKIRICVKGALQGAVDALAFETLVPKSVLQRYMALLGDNGRIIICGPSGTGKSYLARKLGEFLVARSGKDPCPEAIASFSADHKNSKELRQYLTNLVEQCDGSGGIDLPSVIILDNLHQVANLENVFNGVLSSKQQDSPMIVGTMTQSASSPPNVQLHHNFRWVLFGNNMEPVKGLLSRYLQRRLIEVDTQNGTKNLELARVVDWIPKVWHHINKFLESHNSADVTIGPRLFLSCPMDVANSQAWFTDLWHYSVVPYLMEAVKEGLQIYGKKSQWEDPSQYLILTYPWPQQLTLNTNKSSLQRIRPEDVGYDTKSSGAGVGGAKLGNGDSAESDPLMNMLLRLQEAANYSGPQSNDSDSTSLDSHVSLDPKDYLTTA